MTILVKSKLTEKGWTSLKPTRACYDHSYFFTCFRHRHDIWCNHCTIFHHSIVLLFFPLCLLLCKITPSLCNLPYLEILSQYIKSYNSVLSFSFNITCKRATLF